MSESPNGPARTRTALLAVAIAFAAAPAFAANGLDVAVTDIGLARLAWAGANLLKDGRPQVRKVVFERQTRDALTGASSR